MTMIGEILSNLKNILWVSIILPTPPAPTKPRMTLALMHNSKIYRKYAVKFGRTWGNAEVNTVWLWVEPVALAASIGPGSILSIVSESNLPMIARENIISAKTPANGPIPTATVKSIAQNKSGIVLTKFKKDLYKK